MQLFDKIERKYSVRHYTKRLKRLNFHNFELRRLHIDLSGFTKIYFGLVDATDFFEHSLSHILEVILTNSLKTHFNECSRGMFGSE